MKRLLVCLLFLFPLVAAADRIVNPSKARLMLGSESKGVRLDVTSILETTNQPYSRAAKRIGVTIANRQTIIQQLSELRHKIQIHNGNEALKFVRLRTSYSTWMLWPSDHLEVEIVHKREATNIPNYGIRPFLSPGVSASRSGFMGVLSEEAYWAGGFTLPTVNETREGVLITRWILAADKGTRPSKQSVQQVQEFVGEDGEYKRTVLKKASPPQLPNTNWSFAPFSW